MTQNKMLVDVVPTYNVTIYVAGDILVAKDELRQECMEEGLCVTITPTTFVYTGGAEEGMAIGLVNYPRFPKEPREIDNRAFKIAERLINRLSQTSALIVDANDTVWMRREDRN